MRENNRNSIEKCRKKLPQFTTMNVIDGQAGLIIYTSLIFYSLTIDNILNIIVMLILAGVSLNATIGDNGIITQAQNATIISGIAELEEFLQQKYVEYYNESDEYPTKIDLLDANLNNLLLKDGVNNYIVYEGQVYYLINKSSLPNEIKNSLKGGDTTEYLSYIRLYDVYGVTKDLNVYYCDYSDASNPVILGKVEHYDLNPNLTLSKLNNNLDLKNVITENLMNAGVTVDSETGITIGNISSLKNLEIDGSKHNVTSLYGVSELYALKTLTLSNLNIDNLDGLGNCTMLYYLYIKNCKINDYKALSSCYKLHVYC